MKKILILSGKGGTGKTTIASAFINFSKSKVYADCDVDAPNLDLILELKENPKQTNFYGLPKAEINLKKCIACGKCKEICRFNAIKKINNKYYIDKNLCEGCETCKLVCPTGAINFVEDISGELMLYNVDKNFSTAKLKMGRGNSGKLVTKVKEQIKNCNNSNISIIDGSPGIGCPVIASISGVDFVLIVTEPSISGISDMKRIVETVKIFNIKMAVCVNKYNINIENTNEIEKFCIDDNIPFVGKISYDKLIPRSINTGRNIANIDCLAKQEIFNVYNKTVKLLDVL